MRLLDGLRRRPTTQVPALDALRSLAILLVVVGHASAENTRLAGASNAFASLFFVRGGFVGVDLFFVLSGYLIGRELWLEVERTGGIAVGRFMLRRSFRIWPLYFFFFFFVIVVLGRADFANGKWWSDAVFLTNYVNRGVVMGSWSLGVEEQFYLVWPAVFLALAHTAGRRRVAWVAAIILASWVARLTLFFLDAPEAYIYTAFETRCDQLMCGCLVAVTLRAGLARGAVRALTRAPGLLLVTILALAASRVAEVRFGTSYRDTVGFCVEPGLVALLIVQLFAAHRHPAVRWLDARPMRFLGALSYSIYLYQQLVLHFVPRFVPASLPLVVRLPVTVGLVVVVGWLSHRLVEAPINRYKARFAA